MHQHMLYNVHMDTYAEYIDMANENHRRTGRLDLEVKVNMLADDVKLQARTRQGLQAGLDVSKSGQKTIVAHGKPPNVIFWSRNMKNLPECTTFPGPKLGL